MTVKITPSEVYDIGFTSRFFESKVMRYAEGTYHDNNESEIFIIVNWELLDKVNTMQSLNDFISINSLEKISVEDFKNSINNFYRQKIENSLYKLLDKEETFSKKLNINILDSTERFYKLIYLYSLYNNCFLDDINRIVEKLKKDDIIINFQQINVVFNSDCLIIFGEFSKSSFHFYKRRDVLLRNVTVKSIYQNDQIKNINFNFIQKEPENYISLSKMFDNDRISKSIVIKLSVEQLIKNINNDISNIFSNNVRLFVSNETYVDYSIISTIIKDPGMFHVLHNGVSIVCMNYTYGCNCLELENASIVNGAQTIFNIYRFLKLGILTQNELKDAYLLAKIIQVNEVKSQETKSIISIAANTQKAINSQDLKSNDIYLRNYKNLMEDYAINLEIKRGVVSNYINNIKIEKLAKILDSSINQKPGHARNSSLKVYFENEEDFETLFKFTLSNRNNNFRVLVMLIFLEYKKHLKNINKSVENAAKYADLYFVAYVFGEMITKSDFSKEELDQSMLDEKKIQELTSKYAVDFSTSLASKITNEEKDNLFNTFRKEELYKRMFSNIDKVKQSLIE